MLTQLVYGLRVASALALPELASAPTSGDGGAAHTAPDVVVRFGSVDADPAAGGDTGIVRASADEIVLTWPGMTTVAIRRGVEVTVDPSPGVDESTLRLLLLGPVLAAALHQRGRLVLHASAVAMAGGAIAFLGGSGWGKSTVAAALRARGFGLVTDDVLAVDPDAPHGPLVQPGIPQLKLCPDVVVALGEAPDALSRLHGDAAKRSRPATAGFRDEPLRLRRLYVLADAERRGIDPLTPRDAVIELVRHSYAARLLPLLGPTVHLRQCARLATQVSVRRLRRPRALTTLVRLATMIEEDVGQAATVRGAATSGSASARTNPRMTRS